MCELFGVSAKQATDVQQTLATFAEHGGLTGPHKDGWGIAFFQGEDALIVKAPEQASQSPTLERIQALAPQSSLIISHIRLATRGKVNLENTQPFSHPIGQQTFVFAHNGHVPSVEGARLDLQFEPTGSTDSEIVFSALLALLTKLENVDIAEKTDQLEKFLAKLSSMGPLNILFSDGEYLFAFANKRTQKDGEIRAPGMHYVCRECARENRTEVPIDAIANDQQQLVIFASVPLSVEHWQPMQANKLYVAKDGVLIQAHKSTS